MKAVLWTVGGLVVVLAAAWRVGVRLNLTGSLPVGLYLESAGAPTRGSLVLACLPPPVGSFARARGYVPRGRCPDGGAPVGKLVAAVAGDTVVMSAAGLEVNGRAIPNSGPLTRDSHGRLLPSAPMGRQIVRTGELWLMSPYSPLSFDSRYFGSVEVRSVLTLARPLWTAKRLRSLRSLPP